MPGKRQKSNQEAVVNRATALIAEALDLIDGFGGPPEAAVHLDLALEQLRAFAKASKH